MTNQCNMEDWGHVCAPKCVKLGNLMKPIELFQLCELCRAAFTAFTTGKQELSSYLNIYIHISLSAFMMQL